MKTRNANTGGVDLDGPYGTYKFKASVSDKIRKRSYIVTCGKCHKPRRLTGEMTLAEQLKDQANYICSDHDNEASVERSDHTPTPWHVSDKIRDAIYGADKEFAAQCQLSENAAFIVRAVNCHEGLVNALKRTLKYLPSSVALREAQFAIAKAEGKE